MAKPNRTSNRYPAIPRVDGQSEDVRALVEIVESLIGARNDEMQRALTYADLAKLGMVVQYNGTTIGVGSGDPTIPPIGPPVFPPGTPPIGTPSKPTGFNATGAFTAVALNWAVPTYYGHAFTRIFRSSVDDFGTAVPIQTVIGRYATDVVPPGSTYYYWVQFVNVLGEAGPINALGGFMAQTSMRVTDIMEAMDDLVSWDELTTSLQSDIQVGLAVETFLENNWSIESTVEDDSGVVHVSGMKLLNGASQSKVIFNTDVFMIAPPYVPGSPEPPDPGEPIFLIGPWTDPNSDPDNPTVINRVIMSNTVIGDLTVRDAAIEALRADKITVVGAPGNPSTIAEVIIGIGDITSAQIGDVIQSDNWNPVTHQGWRLKKGPFPTSSFEIFGSMRILDTAGNIIIDAGTNTYSNLIRNSAQQWSQVQGRPTELQELDVAAALKLQGIDFNATKNNIFQLNNQPNAGTYGPFEDGDLWWDPDDGKLYKWNVIAGWQFMADDVLSHFELVGGINSNNIGTYIANAALGTLYFQDSSMIVPVMGSGGGVTAGGGAEYFLCGVTVFIPNVGQATQSVALQFFIQEGGVNNNAHATKIMLRRRLAPAGAWVTLATINTNDKDEWISGLHLDYPSKGVTYDYGMFFSVNNIADTAYIYSSRLLVQVIKR